MTTRFYTVDRPTALRWARYLNELVELEPETMTRLLETRIPCGPGIAESEHVQTWAEGEEFPDGSTAAGPLVSPLGILNGLFRVDHEGRSPISFRVRTDNGRVEGVHLTKSWEGCARCERALEDDEDLAVCDSCGLFHCDDCLQEYEDASLCQDCQGGPETAS